MGSKKNVMEWLKIVVLGISVLFKSTDSVDLPRFLGPGSNVTVILGRDATLTCRVENLQTFKVAWLRVDTQTILTIAGHVITKNHRISVTHGDGAWSLGLKDVAPADGGRYMCQVNTEPMMSQTHHLHVVVPPDIDDERSSSEVLVKEGEDAALRCSASGTPPPAIAWRREDSRHFKIKNETLISKWTGEWLNLTAVQRAMSGVYFCIASNGVPPSVSKRVQINVMFMPSIWASRVAIRAPTGAGVTVQCTSEAFPVPLYYWMLNGEQRLVNGSKYKISISSRGYRHTIDLLISNMSLEDAGAYSCHVENSLGKAQAELFLHLLTTTTTSTTTTTTTTSTTTRPPSTTTLLSYDVESHLDELHRGVLQDPDLDKPYIVLSQHQMQNLVSKWTGEWLNLTAVQRAMSGVYFCIASNGVPPSVSKRVQINVMFMPSIWASRVAIRAPAGAGVTVQCTSEAFPVPLYYWMLNGEQRLVNGSKYKISISSRGYRHTIDLLISNMSLEDAGAYSCHVENSLGKAQAELFLHLLTTTTTSTTTTTTTTSTTTRPPSTTTLLSYDVESHLDELHRGVLQDPDLDKPYIVLSQHQMQNLEMVTTM